MYSITCKPSHATDEVCKQDLSTSRLLQSNIRAHHCSHGGDVGREAHWVCHISTYRRQSIL